MTGVGITFNIKTDEDLAASPDYVGAIVKAMLDIYLMAVQDNALCTAAYGMAVAGISVALNVNLKTAVLLMEHALALRDYANTPKVIKIAL